MATRGQRKALEQAIQASKREAEQAHEQQRGQSAEGDKKGVKVLKTRTKGPKSLDTLEGSVDKDAGVGAKRQKTQKIKGKVKNGEADLSDDVHSDGIGDPDFGDDNDSEEDFSQFEQLRKKVDDDTLASRSSRLKKSASLKRKRRTIHDDDTDEENAEVTDNEGPDDARATEATEQRTEESATLIPKKKVPRKEQPESSEPSLLTQLMQPAPPPKPLLPPKPQGGSPRGATGSATAAQPVKKQASAKPAETKPINASPGQQPRIVAIRAQLQAEADAARSKQIASGIYEKEAQIMSRLEQICKKCSQNSAFRLPPTISVDLSGSFLQDDKLDFFDTSKYGEIVLQPKFPIFPEEFPPGMQEHSLSWWGILDPALGDGKFRAAPSCADPRRGLSAGSGSDAQRLSPHHLAGQPRQQHLPHPPPRDYMPRGGPGGGPGGPPPDYMPRARPGGPRPDYMTRGGPDGPPPSHWRGPEGPPPPRNGQGQYGRPSGPPPQGQGRKGPQRNQGRR